MVKFLSAIALVALVGFINPTDNIQAIINSLKTANAEETSKYFDNFIDLKLPEKEEIKNIGKNQAGIALQSFYKENGIKGFELTSQRDMNGTMYVAGKLLNNGKGYNLTLILKNREGNQQIITIRIN